MPGYWWAWLVFLVVMGGAGWWAGSRTGRDNKR